MAQYLRRDRNQEKRDGEGQRRNRDLELREVLRIYDFNNIYLLLSAAETNL